MVLKDLLNQVDLIQEKIDSFGKLSEETLKRITYKFRLDWNYHSNAIEGNSLTRQETRSVMINNITVEGKPLKDVIEIRGHDKIITDILRIGKGELNLSEKRIKDIHKAIINEETPDKQKKIGEWKTENNHLINYKGEKFDFVSHTEVKEEMHKLINWVNTQYDLVRNKNSKALHPGILAFQFHLKYVSIHPFYDGNGRTARILSNLILINFGFPPVIIKITDKEKYNRYLADIQAYGGSEDLYLEFMCHQLLASQQLVLDAIAGNDIEEADDLDKKILLLEKELSAVDPENEIKEHFSAEVFFKMYDGWISELLSEAIPIVKKFNRFFTEPGHSIVINNGGGFVRFSESDSKSVIEELRQKCHANIDNIRLANELKISFTSFYGSLKKAGLKSFGCNYGFSIELKHLSYIVHYDIFSESGNKTISESGNKTIKEYTEKLLHQPLTKAEIDFIIKSLGNTIYEHIDFHTKKNGIR
ncbi:MAG: Fic family protein [Sediminibacterium sp.]|nr:Fic family protein [Sediminibacterium sp.]